VSILGTAIYIQCVKFSLAPGISDFHHMDSKGSEHYAPQFYSYKLPFGSTLILKRIHTIKYKQYRNINLLSIDVLG
jgi:hypothetical protein